MMNFNNVIFALSTDCYSSVLFPTEKAKTLSQVREIAREAVHFILDGARNYYLGCEISPENKQKSKEFFWSAVHRERLNGSVLSKIQHFERLTGERDESENIAVHTVYSVSARLRWLHTDGFSIELSDKLIEIVFSLQDEQYALDHTQELSYWDIGAIWENSKTKWDQFIEDVLSDVPDSVSTTVSELLNSQAYLDFLWTWKREISVEDFAVLIDAIEEEAFNELIRINFEAAERVKAVLDNLR